MGITDTDRINAIESGFQIACYSERVDGGDWVTVWHCHYDITDVAYGDTIREVIDKALMNQRREKPDGNIVK